MISKSGRYGGAFAHTDITFEFVSWISAEFKMYVIQDYKRLKSDEKSAPAQLLRVTEKWKGLYPYAMKRWHENWDAISPIFKFSKDARTTFYAINAIESLNSTLHRLNRQRNFHRRPSFTEKISDSGASKQRLKSK